MNILVLNGSPRPNGSTAGMIKTFKTEAESAGHTVNTVDVCRKNIHGCLACEYCHGKGDGECSQKDDMSEIYVLLRDADMLVLASPIYYHNVSGQLKCVIDRFYALLYPKAPGRLKKVAMFLASGDPDMYDGAKFSYDGDFLGYLGLEDMGIFTNHDKGVMEKISEMVQRIVDLERGFNPIHYKDAVKLGEILNISPDELLNEHTRFCKPGYGICIAKIREMYGMTQQEFSDLISVTRSRLSAWESECTGFHPNEESFNKIKNLAVGIGIDFNRLMDNPAEYRDEYNIFVESNWGLKIKQIRLAHGMLLEEYASVIGCDKQTLEHWEIECVRPLRKYFPAIKETAIACGIELDRLNANPSYFGSDFQRFIDKDCNKKIKSIRMAYGMTTYALGNLIGCTGEAVCRWEKGICTPELKYFKTIERIAKEKGITIAELNETPELIGDDYELFCNSGYSKVIRSIRKQCGMLQGEFAKELDVSRSSLANWEQGRFIPSRDNYNILKKYAEERGLSLDES